MDTSKTSLFKQTLSSHGMSLTKTRQIVFNIFDQPEPQSMNDLVKASKGRLDRASLYRTINLFEELGIVNRINIGFKYKLELSDSFSRHHHHLVCLGCGRIINTEEDHDLEEIIKKLAGQYDFKLTAHQLEIQGLCKSCIVK